MTKYFKKIILSNGFVTKIAVWAIIFNLKRKYKIKFGKKVFIGASTICEGRNYFGNNSIINSSSIGFASYISDHSKISKARIGRFTSIGPNVNCIFGKHPSHTFVSTHPAFFSIRKQVGFSYTDKQLFDEFAPIEENSGKYSIIIGNDVWIGANVSIMDGVCIGDGAIVAANALVNKDVPAYAIVGGVPAKLIKMRFSENHINFLKNFKWWDKNPSWIEKNASKFINVNDFCKTYQNAT